MAFVVFFSITYAFASAAHVRMSLLLDRIPGMARQLMEVLSTLLGMLFTLALIWGGWLLFWESWVLKETMYGAVYLHYWVAKLAMVVAMLLAFAILLRDITYGHKFELVEKIE